MNLWKVFASHLVAGVPAARKAETVDDIREWVQCIADSREGDFGDLFFKIFNKPTGRELHVFFLDKKAKKRMFMKLREGATAHAQVS